MLDQIRRWGLGNFVHLRYGRKFNDDNLAKKCLKILFLALVIMVTVWLSI